MESIKGEGSYSNNHVPVMSQESKETSEGTSQVPSTLEATTMERKREAEVSESNTVEKRVKVAMGSGSPAEETQVPASAPPIPEAMQPLSNPSGVRAAAALAVGVQVLHSGPTDEAHFTKEDGSSEAAVHEAVENAVVAPGVVKLAPFDRTIHNTSVFSKASTHVESLPPMDFQERMQDAYQRELKASAVDVKNRKQPLSATQLLPPGTPADRPPVTLEELKMKRKQDGVPSGNDEDRSSGILKLPSCSSWFNENNISSLERDVLPSLFFGSSVSDNERQKVYMQLRQSILNLYREKPQQHLSFSDCRKQIDYWGIINFEANPATVPSSIRRKREFLMRDMLSWSQGALFDRLQQQGDAAIAAAGSAAETSAAPEGEGPWRCVSCGKICLYSYYVLRPGGTAGVSLGVLDNCVWCLRCHADGRFPHVLTARNFLKVDLPISACGTDGSGWQLDETERLIEAIELHKDDWREVAEHVGNGRTPQQCVERFIQLPTQEPFLEASKCVVSGSERTPFSTFANPLLSLLAMLSSVVHPSVAAAAAQAALRKTIELSGNCVDQVNVETGSKPAGEVERSESAGTAELSEEGSTGASMFKTKDANEVDACVDNGATKVKVDDAELKLQEASRSRDLLVSEEALQVAAATALAAGAASASDLAEVERKNIDALMRSLVDLQLRRIELKLSKLRAVEDAVARSKEQMETKFRMLLAEHRDVVAEVESMRRIGGMSVS